MLKSYQITLEQAEADLRQINRSNPRQEDITKIINSLNGIRIGM